MDSDDKTARNDGGLNNLLAKPLVSIIIAALMGAGGATGLQLTLPEARTDAFTATDALKMEYRLLKEMDKRIGDRLKLYSDHELTHIQKSINYSIEAIRKSIPPQALRDRVVSLEEFARRTDANYNPPTRKWNY